MVDRTTNAPDRATSVETDVADARSRIKEEGQALSSALGRAGESVRAEASELGGQAASKLGAEAEGVRDEAAAGLVAFSDALKAASSELSGKRLGFAGDIVQQAAGGLETLARSLEGRSPGEMLEGIRSFGRQNPVGFIAGSVLAGFALGRVAAAVPSHSDDRGGDSGSQLAGMPGASRETRAEPYSEGGLP